MLIIVAMVMAALGTCSPPSPVPLPVSSPSPSPSPILACEAPSACPFLAVWSNGPHHWMDSHSQLVEGPQVGGVALFDSTPKFGANRMACNQEDHRVCGAECDETLWRKCEDPRGATWEVTGAGHLINVQLPGPDTGFQARVGLDAPGLVEVRTCPPLFLVDASGQVVEKIGDACHTFAFRVPN